MRRIYGALFTMRAVQPSESALMCLRFVNTGLCGCVCLESVVNRLFVSV